MRLLICGGRNLDVHHAWVWLARNVSPVGVEVVIVGGQTGGDTAGYCWAVGSGLPYIIEPAEWTRYRGAAGPIRNRKMIIAHRPTCVIALPGHTGTANMIRQAREHRIPVLIVPMEIYRDTRQIVRL